MLSDPGFVPDLVDALRSTRAGRLSLYAAIGLLVAGCSGENQEGGRRSGDRTVSGGGAVGPVGPTAAGGAPSIDVGAVPQGGSSQPSGGTCGDGALQRSEGCDDTNTDNGDGCSRICQIEANWTCPSEGKPCEYLGACGNGVLTTNKTCDDANTESADGCSGDCQTVEPGFICRVPGKPCTALCGDGTLKGYEGCDDGNGSSGDGCSASCNIEPGFDCSGSPSACAPTVCGNGKQEAGETCDDGNQVPFDGCSPTCQQEPECGTATSAVGACKTVCGDGISLSPAEECDDGNVLAHDGCSPDCNVEPGYTCRSPSDDPPPSLTIPIIARDFEWYQAGPPVTGHLDFNHYCCDDSLSGTIVQPTLGLDRKPVWAGPNPVTNPETLLFTGETWFDQWYRDIPGTNQTFYQTLTLLQDATVDTTYAMNSDTDPPWLDRCGFFPLDSDNPIVDQNTGQGVTYTDSVFPGRTCHAYQGLGFGNGWANHNFSFTTEARHWFRYQGNETLRFTGDDDVWVFINGTLAVDLGGVHNRAVATVILDAARGTAQVGYGETPAQYTDVDLHLTLGDVYELVVFQAERWCCGSNYMLTLANFLAGRSECVPACGDGFAVANEECDCGDGTGPLPAGCPGPNGDDTYGGCSAICTWGPFCGDGTVQAPPAGPEECDLGKQNGAPGGEPGDRCSIACQNPRVCGDGIADTDLGEECDLGPNNGVPLDGQMQPATGATAQIYCTTNCTIPAIIE